MAQRTRPLVFTVFNGIAFFILGMVFFQAGPSFNDLILISDTDVEGGSYYVLASNFGLLLGSVLAGVVYERIQRKTLTTAMSMTLSGVFTILTPWCSVFAAMVVVHIAASVFISLYETTVTTEEIQAWDGSSESAMQFLTFCLFFGGIVGPLITEPFMAPKEDENNTTYVKSSMEKSSTLEMINASGSANHTFETTVESVYAYPNTYHDNIRISHKEINTSLDSPDEIFMLVTHESNIHYAYMITGGLSILVSIVFFIASIKYNPKKHVQTEEKALYCLRKLPQNAYIIIMGIVCLYFYFITMSLDSFERYRFYFLVTHLDWSKQNGSYVASLHKATAMFTKLLHVLTFKFIESWIIFILSLSGAVISLALFCIGSQLYVNELVWASNVILAVSQAPLFAGLIGWVDHNLLKLSGKEISAIMIASNLGAMSGPLPIGYLMKNWSLMTFPYFMLLLAFISEVMFFTMLFGVNPITSKRYGPLWSVIINNADESVADAMV